MAYYPFNLVEPESSVRGSEPSLTAVLALFLSLPDNFGALVAVGSSNHGASLTTTMRVPDTVAPGKENDVYLDRRALTWFPLRR